MLPDQIQDPVRSALHNHGDQEKISGVQRVGGGCIHQAYRIETKQHKYFLKWDAYPLPGIFTLEEEGLKSLRGTGAIRVPEVIAANDGILVSAGFILLEWIGDDASRSSINMAELGVQLALLHKHKAEDLPHCRYGFEHNNYIGRNIQENTWCEEWTSFFRDNRLIPQYEMATRKGLISPERQKKLECILNKLDSWLNGVKRTPSLLHGDLWGGNVIADTGGEPVLIDPAVYYGDREAELAFTELFGGFAPSFYEAYHEEWPLEAGYSDRRDLYNLYHVLNHLNLFGEPYGHQADRILNKYVG